VISSWTHLRIKRLDDSGQNHVDRLNRTKQGMRLESTGRELEVCAGGARLET
jgi:hypothetical protein